MAYVLQISQSSPRAIEPIQVYSKIKEISPLLRKGMQNDAHEFFKSIVESMINVLTKMTTEVDDPKEKVWKIFCGCQRSLVKCMSCKSKTEQLEDFVELNLNIENRPSVTSALKWYFDVEGIEEFDCSTCKKKVYATRQLSVKKAPITLSIVLKRFDNQLQKISDKIKVPTEVDISKYRSSPPNEMSNPMKYRLRSIISHIGETSQSGHYTTLVCKNRNKNELHYEFNDSSVKKIPFNNISTANAYILLYEMIPGPSGTRKRKDGQVQSLNSSVGNSSLLQADKREVNLSLHSVEDYAYTYVKRDRFLLLLFRSFTSLFNLNVRNYNVLILL